MKILIASDIHGSAYWCEKLVEAFKREGADRLALLGDILYHGPRNPLPQGYAPAKVVELLTPLAQKITCVRGNCESEVDQMVFAFQLLFGLRDHVCRRNKHTPFARTQGGAAHGKGRCVPHGPHPRAFERR